MFNIGRGFGFITDDNGGPDTFVHVTALQNSGLHAEDLKIGTRLRYEVEQTRDGRTNAVDVHTV